MPHILLFAAPLEEFIYSFPPSQLTICLSLCYLASGGAGRQMLGTVDYFKLLSWKHVGGLLPEGGNPFLALCPFIFVR